MNAAVIGGSLARLGFKAPPKGQPWCPTVASECIKLHDENEQQNDRGPPHLDDPGVTGGVVVPDAPVPLPLPHQRLLRAGVRAEQRPVDREDPVRGQHRHQLADEARDLVQLLGAAHHQFYLQRTTKMNQFLLRISARVASPAAEEAHLIRWRFSRVREEVAESLGDVVPQQRHSQLGAVGAHQREHPHYHDKRSTAQDWRRHYELKKEEKKSVSRSNLHNKRT